MSSLVTIGQVPWSREAMIEQLPAFAEIYGRRPIRENVGGMRAPHMFLTWFTLSRLKPTVVVESGVWKGLGTWLIEQACPDARLYCLDPVLDRLLYRSNRASYLQRDFTVVDWQDVPREDTVLFFDDHQNALDRLKAAKEFGFRHLIFEDNYPPSRGDCYSLKKAFAGVGFVPHPNGASLWSRLRTWIPDRFSPGPVVAGVPANDSDAAYLNRHLEVYWECPPIFRSADTRWGDPWSDERYPTPPALLDSVRHEYEQIFFDEAEFYTWMCYVRLI
jgi:hypothetical protein